MGRLMDPVKRLRQYRENKKTIDPDDVEIKPLTPGLAQKYDQFPKWMGERKLSPSRIAYLLDVIAVISMPFYWYTVCVGRKIFRINGQHSSRILTMRPDLIREGMYVVLVEYKCVDLTEASLLYSSIDPRISSRNTNDMIQGIRGGHPRLDAHKKSLISLCSSGIRLSVKGANTSATVSAFDIGEFLLKNLDFIDTMAEVVGSSKTDDVKHMWRGPVVYAMHRTYRAQKASGNLDDFIEFWTAVRNGDDVRGTIPDLFREYLIATGVGESSNKRSRADNRLVMCEKSIRAWNAWQEGKSYKSFSPIRATGYIPPLIINNRNGSK